MARAHDHTPAGRVPFWVHQLVELLLGGLLLIEGARAGEHTAVLVPLGVVLLLLALCSDGALGAWRWVGRRLHRVLDLVAAALLALSPVLLGLDHVFAIVVLEAAAAAMVWLALRTEWRATPKRATSKPATMKPATTKPATTMPATSKPGGPPTAGSPTVAPPTEGPAPVTSGPQPRPAPSPSAPVARKLGTAVGRARDDGPRELGRLVGRARRAAKAAMASSEPEPADRPPEPPEEPRSR
jgi:hypothetical protein